MAHAHPDSPSPHRLSLSLLPLSLVPILPLCLVSILPLCLALVLAAASRSRSCRCVSCLFCHCVSLSLLPLSLALMLADARKGLECAPIFFVSVALCVVTGLFVACARTRRPDDDMDSYEMQIEARDKVELPETGK